MARTIKDMAHEFGWTQYEDGRGYAAFCFEIGANAIIKEIERIIDENEDGCLALERIQLRLSELKEK